MLTANYNSLIGKIDIALKTGRFNFKYKDYKESYNVFTGKIVEEFWQSAQAIERQDHFIIDSNGVFHSLLKHDCKDLQLPWKI